MRCLPLRVPIASLLVEHTFFKMASPTQVTSSLPSAAHAPLWAEGDHVTAARARVSKRRGRGPASSSSSLTRAPPTVSAGSGRSSCARVPAEGREGGGVAGEGGSASPAAVTKRGLAPGRSQSEKGREKGHRAPEGEGGGAVLGGWAGTRVGKGTAGSELRGMCLDTERG
ncbi:hypothetical protein NDU88_012838 [Pleurodeles waltl]|uniref:Uncharacterized protein n=1 Tax=Pleurodeles waltl TaxID=8319 RepID=A0AAV7R3Y4_PLEWA|nr:hypothetical protein NDU88_012838 [Pleurodeles waltl]